MNSATTQTIKLRGAIENYRCTRKKASFAFTKEDLGRFEGIATIAALSGLAGQAVSLSAAASDADEPADYVEFDLNGHAVKGWLWRSPFNNGDVVEVAARREGEYFEAIGIARPIDRVIALYPHCSRGRTKHYANSMKIWFFSSLYSVILAIIVCSIANGIEEAIEMLKLCDGLVPLSIIAVAAVIAIRATMKWMKFVRIAEFVFSTLQLKNPHQIDLVKSSKRQRLKDDPSEYGVYYFRY